MHKLRQALGNWGTIAVLGVLTVCGTGLLYALYRAFLEFTIHGHLFD